MSAGLGRVQSQILNRLQSAGTTTLESLRWDLWYECNPEPSSVKSVLGERLPDAWNNKVRNAVSTLIKRGWIGRHEHYLSNATAFIEHYPNKTLAVDVRLLRTKLLPFLFKWAESEGGPRAWYSLADNEIFQWKSLPGSAKSTIERKWRRVEPRLIQRMQAIRNPGRNNLFLLCSKAKSLFEALDIECRPSFGYLAKQCYNCLPQKTTAAIHEISELILNPEHAEFLQLKSLLYAFARVPQHGSCELMEATVNHLDAVCHDLLSQLPGYKPGDKVRAKVGSTARRMVYEREKKTVHSSMLHKLIDHKAFERFVYLKVT
jgi:hypothetical protein